MSKNAIVTGGARGLGGSMVLKLAEMGYNVVVNFVSDRSKALSDDLIARVEKEYGVQGLAVQADVSDYHNCEKLVHSAVEKFGPKIDVLVNNAGIDNNKGFLDLTPEQYTKLIGVNLMSYLHCAHVVLPYMVEAKEGCIINVSSVGGMMGVQNQVDYSAAKSGVIGFTRSLAVEFGRYNIRVNTISPGMIMTDMLRALGENELTALTKLVPIGKIGEAEDISGCMEYLINAPYVTGQNLSPNGGAFMQ